MRFMLLLALILAIPMSSLQAQEDGRVSKPDSGALITPTLDSPFALRTSALLPREVSVVAPLEVESFRPVFEPGSRFERAMAGAGYGSLIGGVTFGLADYLAGPFFDSTPRGFSVMLSSLIGAVFVGMPIGAVIGAATGG